MQNGTKADKMNIKQFFKQNPQSEKAMIKVWQEWHAPMDKDLIPDPNPSFMKAWMEQQKIIDKYREAAGVKFEVY